MKNNIKKAPVKFREDLLYFQHFMLILSLPKISDYHHLKFNLDFFHLKSKATREHLVRHVQLAWTNIVTGSDTINNLNNSRIEAQNSCQTHSQ